MSGGRPTGARIAPMPADRVPPFLLVRDRALETNGVKLAGTLLTSFPKRGREPPDHEAVAIDRAHANIVARMGELPAGWDAVWIEPRRDGAVILANLPAESWIQRKLADCGCYRIVSR